MNLKEIAYASGASQDGWEMYQVLKAVAELNPKVIVEIGIDGGGGLVTYSKAFPKAKLIGIDINQREIKLKADLIWGNSLDTTTINKLRQTLGNQKIEFLWIDGDHHYEYPKAEFNLYKDLVSDNGVVGFHDTNSRGIDGVEVDRFMAELDQGMSYKTADFRADNKSPGSRLIWLN